MDQFADLLGGALGGHVVEHGPPELDAVLVGPQLCGVDDRRGGRRVDELSDPGVGQHLLCRVSALGVPVQQVGDQVLGLAGNRVPHRLAKSEGTGLDRLQDLLVVVAVEGRVARQHHEQDHPQTPDIALLVVGAREDLGGHVVAGTSLRGHLALRTDGLR